MGARFLNVTLTFLLLLLLYIYILVVAICKYLLVNDDFLCGWPYDYICTHELLLCVNPTSFPLPELFII